MKHQTQVVPGWEETFRGPSRLDCFWSKVQIRNRNACWLWQASTNGKGYGQFRVSSKRKPMKANVVSFFLSGRKLKTGQSVLHTCHNRLCVNPAHLYAGTSKQNTHDMYQSGRAAWGERHGGCVLSSRDVKEARKLYFEDNLTQREIADCLGVSRPAISLIVNEVNRLGELQ